MATYKDLSETQKRQAENELVKRDLKLFPVIKKILSIIADSELASSLAEEKECDSTYEDAAKKILVVLKDNACSLRDLDTISGKVDTMKQYIFNKLMSRSLDITYKQLETKVYGKEISELTFQEVDDILKK